MVGKRTPCVVLGFQFNRGLGKCIVQMCIQCALHLANCCEAQNLNLHSSKLRAAKRPGCPPKAAEPKQASKAPGARQIHSEASTPASAPAAQAVPGRPVQSLRVRNLTMQRLTSLRGSVQKRVVVVREPRRLIGCPSAHGKDAGEPPP